ncbi:MAG: ribosome-associated translation inhibitor RaiA [Burkholderiales bacterium]|jgi:putative sigma-54 modulation protein|nr:ribosome-associated translation inhibitor RaiA [Burkholderiales bacterium]
MNLQLTGHHLEITPPIREYVTSKLDKINRHFEDVIDINIILSMNKLQHKAEATLRLPGKDLHAESIESDMYAAIDVMIDKLDRAVLKQKERRVAKRTQGESIRRMSAPK